MEIWKDVKGFEGYYQVSNLGNIKSIKRKTGNQFSSESILKIQLNKYGYSIITLWKNNNKKTHTVHKLVAEAFVPNPENKPQVNHKNGIKTDNRVENLEWCTGFENQLHRFNSLGHTIHNRLLTKEQVFEILSKNGKGWRKELAKKFEVSEACIKAVRSGKNYTQYYNEFKNLSVQDLIDYGWVKLNT